LIIFNLAGVAFLVLAVFGGWGVKFSAWALGFDDSAKNLGFGVAWCVFVILLDLGCRSTRALNPSRRNWLRFMAPRSGGQLFFIPVWIIATALMAYQLVMIFK
jgi:hypothetical protein